jgi:glucose-fructose oxidoreductase
VRLENAYSYTGERVLTTTRNDKPRHRTFRQVDQFAPELAEFSRCVLEGRNPEPDGWEGLADVRAILAMHASAESGRPVTLAPFDRPRHPSPGQARRKPPVQKPEEIHVSSPHH